jgi:TP901 family phage tail tape measure protein
MAAGRIKGITIEIGGDTTKLEQSLKSVDSSLRKTQSSLKDVNKLLKLDPSNTELLTQKQGLLKKAVEETRGRLQTLKETAENVTPEDIGQEKYDALQREIIDTENQLKSLESQSASAASVLGSQMQAAGEKIKDVGGKVTEIGTNLTQKLTVPLVAVGGIAVAKFAEVDKTMQLVNQTMGNTADQADMLNQAMKDAASNSTFGMSDAANATLNFARAGLTAEEAAAALAPAMNLAAGEGGNLDTVSAGLVATINGFGGSFSEAGHYADVFANACNNSALDVDSLSNAMSVAAPVFSAAGYSINDAALYMGVMANAGIDAEQAANSLKTGLARLVSPTDEAAKQLDALGISVTNSDGTMKDSTQIQKELHDAFGQLSESEQIAAASAIFGKNQMAPWLALINTAPSDVGELSDALGTQGTTAEMASAMMSGFGGSIEKLKSSIDVLATSLGEALAPTIQQVANFIQGLVDKFNSLSPAQQETIAKIGLLIAALGPVITIVGGIISVIGTVVGAIGTIITAVSAFVGVLSAGGGAAAALGAAIAALGGPVTVVVGIIVGLIAVGGLLIANWDTVKAAAASIWNAIKTTIANVMTSIKTTLTNVWNTIKTTITTVLNAIKTVITTVFNAVKTTVTTIWNAIKTAITTVVNAIKTVITTVWNAIKTTVTTVVNAIKTTITTVWNAIKSTVTSVLNAIKSTITSVWNAAKSTVTNVVNGIKSTVTSGFNAAKSTVTNVMNGIKSTITSVWNAAKSTVTNVINGIKTTISSGLNAAKSTVTNIFTAIKDKIKSVMDAAKDAVSNAIEKIKSKFNFHWSLPKLKLPHISINGKFSLNPPSVPHFSISWQKTAMENGLIFTNPTIFGMMGGKLQGAGDAGAEALIGVNSLTRKIQAAVASVGTNDPDVIYAAVKAGMENANVGIYIGEREFGRMLKGQGVVFA